MLALVAWFCRYDVFLKFYWWVGKGEGEGECWEDGEREWGGRGKGRNGMSHKLIKGESAD